MKRVLRQQVINLDDEIKNYKALDAEELAAERGVEYIPPRPISEIAIGISAEMRVKKKPVMLLVADPDIIPEIRRLLIRDLNRIGSQYNVSTFCNVDSNRLYFKYLKLK